MDSFLLLVVGLCIAILPFLLRKRTAPFPPGPKGLPVIGNILDYPTSEDWLTFTEWGRKFGAIVGVKLLGQPIIIINSADVIDQLDKLGAIYSDRPRLEMGGELCGYAQSLVLMPYNATLRNFRRYVTRMIGSPSAVSKYHAMEEAETHRFLQRVLAGEVDLGANLRSLSGSVIMKLAYGIEIEEKNDPFVTLIEHTNDNFNLATTPGMFLVDVCPLLRFVPEWFPGAHFKRLARKYRQAFEDMVELPYAHSKKLIASGEALSSFVSRSTENEEKLSPQEIWEIKHTAASLYAAGADTTVSEQHAFFLAMILFPDIQRKAQAEIDAVVGTDRLPTFADWDRLPYVKALISEVLRWHNVAPIGVPHRAMEDHVVAGHFIPKGALVIANLWGMQHDPAVYPDPFTFDPTRFLESSTKPTQLEPRRTCFGFARRICVGMYLAEASLYICVAMSLAAFNITNALDEHGNPIIPVHENTSGTISQPKPFKYSIKPRSEKALSLITAEYH